MNQGTARLDLTRLAALRELDEINGRGVRVSYLDRAIELFLVKAPMDVETMQEAVCVGDGFHLQHVAHRLSGASHNLGAVTSGRAAQLVHSAVEAGDIDEAAASMSTLTTALDGDLAALGAYARGHWLDRWAAIWRAGRHAWCSWHVTPTVTAEQAARRRPQRLNLWV